MFLGTWFSGGLHSAGFTVGLNDFRAFFQLKRYFDSIIISIGTLSITVFVLVIPQVH